MKSLLLTTAELKRHGGTAYLNVCYAFLSGVLGPEVEHAIPLLNEVLCSNLQSTHMLHHQCAKTMFNLSV